MKKITILFLSSLVFIFPLHSRAEEASSIFISGSEAQKLFNRGRISGQEEKVRPYPDASRKGYTIVDTIQKVALPYADCSHRTQSKVYEKSTVTGKNVDVTNSDARSRVLGLKSIFGIIDTPKPETLKADPQIVLSGAYYVCEIFVNNNRRADKAQGDQVIIEDAGKIDQ